jgi:hypothetical protein
LQKAAHSCQYDNKMFSRQEQKLVLPFLQERLSWVIAIIASNAIVVETAKEERRIQRKYHINRQLATVSVLSLL